MQQSEPPRLGYVVKRYPRFSETFIVNEILAHERAGVPVHIFALRRVTDSHFQSILSQVRSPVTYIPDSMPKADLFWQTLSSARRHLPELWPALQGPEEAEALDVYQAAIVAAKVRELGIGHLHAHFGTVATSVARLAARFARTGYSFTAHAKDIFHADVDADTLRTKLADAAAVVTVSDFNVRWLSEHYGAAAAGVRRIYNGLDLSAFPYRSPEERPPTIVTVGRLVEKKGFDVLIDACALLRSRGITFNCTIIGDGPMKEGLAARINAFALSDRVDLVGPRPQCDVVQALYEGCVFAAPCIEAQDGDRDGLPTVLLEAMALGTPCVSTDVTGIPEVLRHGSTGLLVPQGDAGALADALARLLDDARLRVRLSEQARSLMEQEFDVDRNAAAIRDLFEEVIPGAAEPLQAVG